MARISSIFQITDKGWKDGCTPQFYKDQADELLRHHYNDDYYIDIRTYYEVNREIGIMVEMDTYEDIMWFVDVYVKKGDLVQLI